MKINIGTEIPRTFGKKTEMWKVTRIELNENKELSIFACHSKWFSKHPNIERDKKHLYHEDELILKYESPETDVR